MTSQIGPGGDAIIWSTTIVRGAVAAKLVSTGISVGMCASKHNLREDSRPIAFVERQRCVMEMQNSRFRRTLTGVARACSFHHEPERVEAPPVRPRVWDNAAEMLDDQFPSRS